MFCPHAQLHTAHPSDPSKKWLHYEVVIESSKSVVICDYEEIAPVRVRLTLQEYEFIMGTDSEETVDIKKMNNTEVCSRSVVFEFFVLISVN
jgi:hypothetical protein